MPTSWPTGRRSVREERSFASVAEAHLDDVYRYLLYVTGNPHLAEDLAAATFERALRRWRRFDPRRGTARTWLCQLARSTALDHFRTEQRRRKREDTYATEVPETDEPIFGEGLSPALDCRGAKPVGRGARGRRPTRRAGAGWRDGSPGARHQADGGLHAIEQGPAEARGEDGQRCPRLGSRALRRSCAQPHRRRRKDCGGSFARCRALSRGLRFGFDPLSRSRSRSRSRSGLELL